MAVLLGLLLLFAGAAGLLIFALVRRAQEQTLFRRVGAIADAPAQTARKSRVRAPRVWLGAALDALRSLFAFRMRRSWGIFANPAYLLAAGAVAAAAVWLASLVTPHLPPYAGPVGAALAFFVA